MSVIDEVKKGIALLDSKVEGWRERIDVSKLDMASGDSCIVGQVFGSYGVGLDALGIESGRGYGFYPAYSNDPTVANFNGLRSEWIIQLQQTGA